MARARFFCRSAAVLLAFAVLAPGIAASGAPRVVASIAPLHSLAAMAMGDLGAPKLLLRGSASPHSHALSPSDTTALNDADLVIRIGNGFEPFLDKAVASLRLERRILDISDLPGVMLLKMRGSGPWTRETRDEISRAAQPHARDADGHDHTGETDLHLWLHTGNAQATVTAIADRLAVLDPANASIYRQNASAARHRIDGVRADMASRLWPVRNVPFAVLHDAWQYAEREFGLRAVGAIAVSPERSPGARRLVELRARIRETGARCVFSEPQFPAAIVRTVIRNTRARTATLDPLGAVLEPGPGLYPELMRNLARDLADCLQNDSGSAIKNVGNKR